MKPIALALFALCLLAPVRAEDAKPAKKKTKTAAAAKAPSLHDKFAALDTNKDGVIDKAELEAYEKLVLAENDKADKKHDDKKSAEIKAEIEAEYQKEDAAHDGKVTEAEFSADAPKAQGAK